jgi:hypothetical protein
VGHVCRSAREHRAVLLPQSRGRLGVHTALRTCGGKASCRRRASIDRDWPHQVALPASASANCGYKTIHAFCKDLSLCPRGHSVFHEDQWFNVYCFAEASDAENFMKRFGGEKFSPKQRGRGSNWARWKK